MKELKEKLVELGLEVKWVLYENGGYEDDFFLNVNGIDIFEGAYQKWDTCIEEEGYLEKSFMNDEELINYIKEKS